MKVRKLALVGVSAIATASLVIVSPAESAPRHWPRMVVSLDGQAWSRNLTTPLFPRSMAWVPGDRMTRQFLVRNQSGVRAALVVGIAVRDKTRWLNSSGLHFKVRTAGKKWVPVTKRGYHRVLIRPMAAGQVRRVLVRVTMDGRSGNNTMGRTAPFRLRLRMTSATGR